MARTENEKNRDAQQTNLLTGIFKELEKVNTNLVKLIQGGKDVK